MEPPTSARTANERPQRPVGWGDFCTDSSLKRGHYDGKEMVRCLHCAQWMHEDCVALQEEYYPGSWVCFSCRQLPSKVISLTDDMARLVKLVQGMATSMSCLQDQHERAVAQADTQHQKMTTENAELRQRISDLSQQASSVLIGSSVIRDIYEEKLVATQCLCK